MIIRRKRRRKPRWNGKCQWPVGEEKTVVHRRGKPVEIARGIYCRRPTKRGKEYCEGHIREINERIDSIRVTWTSSHPRHQGERDA